MFDHDADEQVFLLLFALHHNLVMEIPNMRTTTKKWNTDRSWSSLQDLLLIAAIGCAVVFATGCNTMKGAGEDIESAGESIQDAAD